MRVRNRAEKIKFDRISGSSLMPLLPLLLCVNRTLGTISGDCRAALATTGKAVLRCGDGMAAAMLAFCHCEERSDEAISSVSNSVFLSGFSLLPFWWRPDATPSMAHPALGTSRAVAV